MPLKHSYSTWGVSSVGQSRGLIILWSSVQVTHALPIQTRVCRYENSSKPFLLPDDVRADVRRFSKSMPPWAGFCARWRCRPAGRHFSFCWYFCWYFSGKQAVYRGRCGSIHESNGFSTSSAHAKSTSAALQNSGFIGLQARRAKRRLRCQPARQPARQPLGKAPDSVLRRLLRCTVTAPKNTGWRVNRRLLTTRFDR